MEQLSDELVVAFTKYRMFCKSMLDTASISDTAAANCIVYACFAAHYSADSNLGLLVYSPSIHVLHPVMLSRVSEDHTRMLVCHRVNTHRQLQQIHSLLWNDDTHHQCIDNLL